ncbi:uncharacterized protein [Palaemon carinicauda]|uniref:uncharacterized protein n=1 Tax=Palaemon carinicauda TaxID=392227 RepID=UPI0035B659AC
MRTLPVCVHCVAWTGSLVRRFGPVALLLPTVALTAAGGSRSSSSVGSDATAFSDYNGVAFALVVQLDTGVPGTTCSESDQKDDVGRDGFPVSKCDADYKPYVSSECDIKSLEIEGDEDFLILACDGLWDTLSPEDAVNVVYAYLTHNNGDTDGVGRCLVEAARSTGSEDNITAVVVFLRPVATLMEEEAQRIAQGQVPDEVPAVLMEKDATPSSINAIFSPPIFTSPFSQFEMSENAKHLNMDDEFTNGEKNRFDIQNDMSFKDQDESVDSTKSSDRLPRDSDSDEGIAVGNDDTQSAKTPNVHDAPTPTAERVSEIEPDV